MGALGRLPGWKSDTGAVPWRAGDMLPVLVKLPAPLWYDPAAEPAPPPAGEKLTGKQGRDMAGPPGAVAFMEGIVSGCDGRLPVKPACRSRLSGRRTVSGAIESVGIGPKSLEWAVRLAGPLHWPLSFPLSSLSAQGSGAASVLRCGRTLPPQGWRVATDPVMSFQWGARGRDTT